MENSQVLCFFLPVSQKVMKILITIAACLLLALSAHAQSKPINSEYYNNLIPKTPEQFKLGTFGSTPINYYTGLPEISLPLMTLEGIGTKLPINLNYDASGIRIDDLSGPVGMKWSLDAGGYIVRDVNGRADEGTEIGFWKTATQTNYFRDMDFTDWSGYSQANSRDTSPDEFAMVLNGRTIRFVFDKNGIARVIPRQNIQITPFFTDIGDRRRIIRFEVVLENGTKYVFGGSLLTVEQREIQTLRIGTSFLYTKVYDCPVRVQDNKTYYNCIGSWDTKFSSDVDFKVTTIPGFTSKWHLTSIVEPSGEVTTFQYEKLQDVTYLTRPSTILIEPIRAPVAEYQKKIEECSSAEIFGWCPTGIDTYYYYIQDFLGITKFPTTPPGSAPVTWQPVGFFSPMKYGWSPGAVNEYRTRIVESNIKLVQITSSTKNRVAFTTSSRSDLPNSFRYDMISLYNMQGQLVKSVKLNFSVIEASKDNERCWISEALMIRNLNSLKTDKEYFFADYLLKHTDSDIDSDNYRKFVFEGAKQYNYYRTFLSSVTDVTALSRQIPLFRFVYRDTDLLRRRTSPYGDAAGFHRGKVYEERYYFSKGMINMAQSFSPGRDIMLNRAPLTGLLTKIYYPTNGSTEFTYGSRLGVRLSSIQDLDEKGTMMSQREIEYLRTYNVWSPVMTSYQDFRVEGTSGWMKYLITSSAAQNDPNLTHGALEGNAEVVVYQGTKAVNNGFERYSFTNSLDYPDTYNELRSHPVERDTNDVAYRMINIFPFPKANNMDHMRGLLKRHQVFAAGSTLDKPIRETFHEYAINPYGYDPEDIIGFRGGSFMWTTSSSTHFFYGNETNAERRYRWGWTHFNTDWIVLRQTKDVIYDDDDPLKRLVQVTDFEYDSIHQQQIEKITYNESNRTDKTIVRYKYITHRDFVVPSSCDAAFQTCRGKCAGTDECYGACEKILQGCLSTSTKTDIQALTLMRQRFQYAVPIETQTWSEKAGVTSLVSSTVNKFKIHKPSTSPSSWSAKPKEIWALKKLVGMSYQTAMLSDLDPNGLILDSRMRKVHTFNSYDLVSGNVKHQTLLDGTVTEYNWEPLSNYSTIKSLTINPGLEQHQTNYQEMPLVGLTSVTDPNNRNTRYQYDLNKRLKVVLDHSNNVTTSYRYHYASESANDAIDASFKISGLGIAGSDITFSAVNDSREYGVTKYSWDFGDASPKKETTSSRVVYQYPATGFYTIVLTKSNPEYGSASSSMHLRILAPLKVTVCIDGPSVIDVPPGSFTAVPGSCTIFPMNLSRTTLKADASGGCGDITYRWEKLSSTGAWEQFSAGTTASSLPPGDFVSRVLGSYKIRCVTTDSCGSTSISNSVDLVLF